MKQLAKEVEANFEVFSQSHKRSMQETAKSLEAHGKKFLESYGRIVTLQAWRSELLEKVVSPDSLAFFLEAQNDALTSHVFAGFGAWRSSLKALRSCIENTLFCLYYMDHPVELQLWDSGRHRLTFSEMESYFCTHPAFAKIPRQVYGLELLSEQYSILSRAVHGSAKNFRMSVEEIGVQLWSDDFARLGKWLKNERDALVGLNRLLMGLFCEQFHHGRLLNLRKAISLLLPAKHHAGIKRYFGITLYP